MNDLIYKIETDAGVCFAVFPSDSSGCSIVGNNPIAIGEFSSKLPFMVADHGRSVDLDEIEPENFLKWCNMPDKGIRVFEEFDDSDIEYL